jgi:hypothetical protein
MQFWNETNFTCEVHNHILILQFHRFLKLPIIHSWDKYKEMDSIVQGYEIKLNTLALMDGEESPVPLTLGGRFGESVEFFIVVSVAGRLPSTYVLSVILHGQLPIPSIIHTSSCCCY